MKVTLPFFLMILEKNQQRDYLEAISLNHRFISFAVDITADSYHEFLGKTFNWADSKEGYEYWEDLYNFLENHYK